MCIRNQRPCDCFVFSYGTVVLPIAALKLRKCSAHCSGELELRDSIIPCAIKTVAYTDSVDRYMAEAELQALHDTRNMKAIMKCHAVFVEVQADGKACLHLITE